MSNDQEIREQLNRIERCLTGDEYGQPGLVERVNEQGGRISKIEQAGKYVSGACALIALLWTVWTQWPRK